MKRCIFHTTVLCVALLASGCEPAEAPESVEARQPIDTTRYIRSADLHRRMQGDALNYVFDVRARASYAESHIEGSYSMPYGIAEPGDVAAMPQMTLDTPIVTYCGCPHTLAGLAADQLIEWGYRNVRVLHEGYWYWRDNRYPVAGEQAQSVTLLRLAGKVDFVDQPFDNQRLFIRNLRNDQLEAAAIGADGRFETDFHVLDYQLNDRFEVRIGGLDRPVIGQFEAPGENRTDHWISVKI